MYAIVWQKKTLQFYFIYTAGHFAADSFASSLLLPIPLFLKYSDRLKSNPQLVKR